MSTLLLRLAAPLQSWGLEDKFERRQTMREPTKSGVIGLLAAALGRRRNEPPDGLAELRFGVRVDQPGQMLRDFHTARRHKDKPPYVTERYYLADAVFLVGLEGRRELLTDLEKAVCAPVFPLYLGRRSCPPEGRLSLGVRDKPLMDALREEEWQAGDWFKNRPPKNFQMAYVVDADGTGTIRRRDIPLTFSQMKREYTHRYAGDYQDAEWLEGHQKKSASTESGQAGVKQPERGCDHVSV